MNIFLFLLTISLLAMLQIQMGVLGNQAMDSAITPALTTTMAPAAPTALGPTKSMTQPLSMVTDSRPTTMTLRTTTRTTTRTSIRTTARTKAQNGAPALSDLGSGRFLFLLHTLIYLFYLS